VGNMTKRGAEIRPASKALELAPPCESASWGFMARARHSGVRCEGCGGSVKADQKGELVIDSP